MREFVFPTGGEVLNIGNGRIVGPGLVSDLIDVTRDQLIILRIEGMHSHQCELTIQDALGRADGVHEVEVDFLSGQASVLIDPAKVCIQTLVRAIEEAGYRPGDHSVGGLGVEA